MVEPLPNYTQLTTPMTPVLKREKDFVHSLDKCHALACQELSINEARNQMVKDLTTKVNIGERNPIKKNVLIDYANTITNIENERKSYLESFMGIYPNSDKLEKKISEDQEKLTALDKKEKAVTASYTKACNTTDPNGKKQAETKYSVELKDYKESYKAYTNEFKQHYLERMETTVVNLHCINSSYSSIGSMKKCIIMPKLWSLLASL